MAVNLYDHQKKAVNLLKSGSVLCGGVGTGKSRTALAFFYIKICGGKPARKGGHFEEIKNPVDLYIITTAKKRDSKEWDEEMAPFLIGQEYGPIKVVVDSWNNIKKYTNVRDSFFIFDEQRLVGTGSWAKAFLKIAKANRWILLTATPGDNWLDYAMVFIANGYYRNITEFRDLHVVYDHHCDYPKVKGYVRTNRLEHIRQQIVVPMEFKKVATQHHEWVKVGYDSDIYKYTKENYWDIYKDEPIKDASSLCYTLRKIVNSDRRRIDALDHILENHPKAIVFYNFDYELELLREYGNKKSYSYSEWNGHKHQPLPNGNRWLYFVQYTAGAEGWNCIETDTVIFFSQNYSWKIMDQSAGRIDRMNTPFTDLFYYHIFSDSDIDRSIKASTKKKKNFSESNYEKSLRQLSKTKGEQLAFNLS